MMRKLLALAFMAAFGVGRAQIVNIPDANFKSALIGPGGIDTNHNGEIEVSEAEVTEYLDLTNKNIQSLQGIEAFTSIIELHIEENSITELDLSANVMLNTLVCNFNQLSTLDLSANTALRAVACADNQLTSLNLTGLHLNLLYCSDNQLTSLDVEWAPGLEDLAADNNHLTAIDLPDGLVWDDINLSQNDFDTFTAPHGVAYGFYLDQCPNLTYADLSQLKITASVTLIYNPGLQFLNLKNGSLDFYEGNPGAPNSGAHAYLEGNTALQFICMDDDDIPLYELSTFHAQDPAVAYSSYCSVTPGGDFNTVTGHIMLDTGSGCSNPVPYQLIAQSNGPEISNYTWTDAQGSYTSYFAGGMNQTLAPQFPNPYYMVTPASYSLGFSDFGNTATADFCISPNGVHDDLSVAIIPLACARPGAQVPYHVLVKNEGTAISSGSVTLNFDATVMTFVSSLPAAAVSPGAVTWSFGPLAPLHTFETDVWLHVATPTDTPPVNIGDVLHLNAQVTGATDETPADNTFAYDQTVVSSYDPNDKTVSRETIGSNQLDQYLYYTVRFQNTGSYFAENVVIKDMLSDKLDVSTLETVSASHPYRATLTAGNKLEFFFEGIELPASQDDEPASHGFVTFKVKPKSTDIVGDVISNAAGIYFDYNAPVVTNTVTTTVTQLDNASFAADDFSLFPNPASQVLYVKSLKPVNICRVSNLLGQCLIDRQPAGSEFSIDISRLPAGTYLLNLDGTTKKFLKQ